MKQTVLVTGANGFLGNNIIRDLIRERYKVIALVRKNSSVQILKNLDCEVYKVASYNSQKLEELVSISNYVIHCASKTDQWTMDFSKYETANILTTKILVAYCKKYQLSRFILVSSANCFTSGTLSDPGNENSDFMNFFKNSGYAYSKYLAQRYVLNQVKESQFPAIVVAPTFMLGSFDVKPSSGVLTQYILNNKILFYPKAGKSFVDVRMVSKSIIEALEKGRIGESYLLSGENMTYKDYYKRVATIINKRRFLIPIPKLLLVVVSTFCRVFQVKKLLRLEANLHALFLDNYFSNGKAKNELSMKDTNIDDAIRETVGWLSKIK